VEQRPVYRLCERAGRRAQFTRLVEAVSHAPVEIDRHDGTALESLEHGGDLAPGVHLRRAVAVVVLQFLEHAAEAAEDRGRLEGDKVARGAVAEERREHPAEEVEFAVGASPVNPREDHRAAGLLARKDHPPGRVGRLLDRKGDVAGTRAAVAHFAIDLIEMEPREALVAQRGGAEAARRVAALARQTPEPRTTGSRVAGEHVVGAAGVAVGAADARLGVDVRLEAVGPHRGADRRAAVAKQAVVVGRLAYRQVDFPLRGEDLGVIDHLGVFAPAFEFPQAGPDGGRPLEVPTGDLGSALDVVVARERVADQAVVLEHPALVPLRAVVVRVGLRGLGIGGHALVVAVALGVELEAPAAGVERPEEFGNVEEAQMDFRIECLGLRGEEARRKRSRAAAEALEEGPLVCRRQVGSEGLAWEHPAVGPGRDDLVVVAPGTRAGGLRAIGRGALGRYRLALGVAQDDAMDEPRLPCPRRRGQSPGLLLAADARGRKDTNQNPRPHPVSRSQFRTPQPEKALQGRGELPGILTKPHPGRKPATPTASDPARESVAPDYGPIRGCGRHLFVVPPSGGRVLPTRRRWGYREPHNQGPHSARDANLTRNAAGCSN